MVAALVQDVAASGEPVALHVMHCIISPAGVEPPVQEVRRTLARLPPGTPRGRGHRSHSQPW